MLVKRNTILSGTGGRAGGGARGWGAAAAGGRRLGIPEEGEGGEAINPIQCNCLCAPAVPGVSFSLGE